MIPDKDIRDIQAYMRGLLPRNRREKFEERLQNDPSFKAKYDELNPILEGLEGIFIEEKVREIITNTSTDNMTDIEENEGIDKKIIPLHRRSVKYVIAACLSFFIVTIGWESYKLSSLEVLPAIAEISRGSINSTCPDSITLNLYTNHDYQKFIKMIDNQPLSVCRMSYKGLGLIKLKDIKGAIKLLSIVILDSTDIEIQQRSEWFLVVALLKNGDEIKAKELLRKIISTPDHHQYEVPAIKLLAELEKKPIFFRIRY